LTSKNRILLQAVLLVLITFHLLEESRAGLSGDPVLDASLSFAYKIRAGGKDAGVNRGFNNADCNSSTAHPFENTCPNDATFTPAMNTGGYQAWTAGLAPIYEEHVGIECEWVYSIWWANGNWIINANYVCYPESEDVLTGYIGRAAIRLKWGTEIAATGNFSSHPTSVMAFHPNTMTPCQPYVLTSTANCLNEVNSSYVEDAGYESDITFADAACAAGLGLGAPRSGTTSDASNGCFHYSATQISDLPAMYRDTTFSDPAQAFNIGFGAANASGIVPGHTYTAFQAFYSTAASIMIDQPVNHRGAVTVRSAPIHPACVYGNGQDAFCYFALDTADVGGPPDQDVFEQVFP